MNEGRVKKYSHLWGCNSVTTLCVLWLWITLFVTCYLMSCLLWRCDVALSEWESVWVVTGGCYDCYDMTHWFTPPKSTLSMITYMSVKQSLLMLSWVSLVTMLSGSLCVSPMLRGYVSRREIQVRLRSDLPGSSPATPGYLCSPATPASQAGETLPQPETWRDSLVLLSHKYYIILYLYYHMKYILTFKIVFSQYLFNSASLLTWQSSSLGNSFINFLHI